MTKGCGIPESLKENRCMLKWLRESYTFLIKTESTTWTSNIPLFMVFEVFAPVFGRFAVSTSKSSIKNSDQDWENGNVFFYTGMFLCMLANLCLRLTASHVSSVRWKWTIHNLFTSKIKHVKEHIVSEFTLNFIARGFFNSPTCIQQKRFALPLTSYIQEPQFTCPGLLLQKETL